MLKLLSEITLLPYFMSTVVCFLFLNVCVCVCVSNGVYHLIINHMSVTHTHNHTPASQVWFDFFPTECYHFT